MSSGRTFARELAQITAIHCLGLPSDLVGEGRFILLATCAISARIRGATPNRSLQFREDDFVHSTKREKVYYILSRSSGMMLMILKLLGTWKKGNRDFCKREREQQRQGDLPHIIYI